MAEHAVFVCLPVQRALGTHGEDGRWTSDGGGWLQLEQELEAAASRRGPAEVDGFELCSDEAVFYLYGSDSTVLLSVVVDALGRVPVPGRPYAIVRRGAFTDPDAREDYVPLACPASS